MSDKTYWFVSPEQYKLLREWLAVNVGMPDYVHAWPKAASMICGYPSGVMGPSGDVELIVVRDPLVLQLARSPHLGADSQRKYQQIAIKEAKR